MTTVKKFALFAILGALLGTTLAACNTVEGAGQDVQAGGRAIERGADNVQKKM
ncbi:entericidin, EcnA/B family [Azospirillum humicireducens]|uniref:Entericidin, EcnA/B family n=1 Tax=Azospirillum humicireducens TaxID=1226968 RepID=A0A160JGY9_9PROT|nr:entericidin A/B family lipoprotein [Azospirillum humicireducens]ANC92278.1 entericidin, EcnA/B family [Azospirillum humicireducens]